MTIEQRIVEIVKQWRDLTERKIAERIFGSEAYQQRVNSTCVRLVRKGILVREGRGGNGDPFRYRLRLSAVG
jgi:hypothetical protein